MAKLLTLVGLLCLLAALAMAAPEDRFEKSWREFRLPPFEVLVERDSNEVRAFLGDLFQYRHLLATVLPGTELRAQWPVRIWVTDQDSATVAASDGRLPVVVDRYVVLLPRNPVLTPELRRSIARTVMEDSLRPLPTWFEQGLLDLLSGVRIERQVLHLGAPPPAAQRTASWAQVHWLLTSKQSVPTLSALAGNLEKGMEERLSLRNSYQMDPAQLEAAARPALTAQSPATVEFSGLANNPRQDFRDWYVPLGYAELAAATRAALSGSGPLRQALGASRPRWGDLDVRARSQLQALDAFSALQGGEEADARTILADLTAIGNTDSAWVYRQAAQLADSKAERQRLARLALEKSASWAEVYRFLASLETAPEASGKLLMEASRRDPRNQALWEETAAVLVQARDFAAADAALEGAARSARTQEEQQRLRDARWALREDRARKDEEDRQSRLADERRQIEDLKAKTMSRIEEALARANRENASADSDAQEVVDLADVDDPESVEGALVRVVCRDKETYLLEIKTTEGYIRLLLKNPSQVVTASGASWDFRCGNLVNPQVVKATYLPKVSSTLGTIGEVLSLSAP